ncbi:MAG: MerC domain-containing protein [Chitinophagaceae bacterium]|nr:MerC domain-containing protein [Chitinophagaceae bacterium]MCW5928883.1 MerC domain-containing protein [Chitinophagaceae bacterium]
MAEKKLYDIKWDAIGISASLVCAIHCLLLPVFFSTLPLLGVELMENMTLEIVTIAISLLAGSSALYAGYKKQHQRLWPLLLFVCSMTALIMGNILSTVWDPSELVFKSAGVTGILVAHIANWRYGRNCPHH